jgi:hypothetical protein
MTHCSDDELLLEYYSEYPAEAGLHASRPSAHINACEECGARYRELKALLDTVTLEPPERDARYGLEVWQSIRHRLPSRERTWYTFITPPWGLAAAAMLLLIAGFAAGRLWSGVDQSAEPQVANGTTSPIRSVPRSPEDDARRRAVLLTLSEHFDRSDRVLAEVMNADGPRELSTERQWATDLIASSRLYRPNVVAMNEPALAAVLEEVERVLLDIVHQPADATAADFEEIRRRIDSAALLFKIRVMSNELQYRLEQPSPARPTTPPSTIG